MRKYPDAGHQMTARFASIADLPHGLFKLEIIQTITGLRLPSGFGAAYGTAKSGVGIASMGVMRPELVMKSIVPVVMAGVLGIYGLIIAVIISTGSRSSSKTAHKELAMLYSARPTCSRQ